MTDLQSLSCQAARIQGDCRTESEQASMEANRCLSMRATALVGLKHWKRNAGCRCHPLLSRPLDASRHRRISAWWLVPGVFIPRPRLASKIGTQYGTGKCNKHSNLRPFGGLCLLHAGEKSDPHLVLLAVVRLIEVGHVVWSVPALLEKPKEWVYRLTP